MSRIKLSIAIILATLTVKVNAEEGTRPAFPQYEGTTMYYSHYDGEGKHDADFTITLRNVTGDMKDGGLEMVYVCKNEKGKPFFDGNNEFLMIVKRVDGQTFITMDKMSKTMKVMNLIMAGDASAIRIPMNVGDTLPDTQINSTLGVFDATLTISDKKVLDHKTLTVGGKTYECWLVHEKILTKTPFSTDTATADTWYAEGAGCVSQTVYNAKGKLKGKLELTDISTKQP